VIVTMFAVTGLLAALLAYAAGRKLSGRPEVVESYARVGVPAARLPLLAVVLLVGAAGLVAGWVWPHLGLAAAISLSVYFCLALVAHQRHRDLEHAVTPAILLALAVAATVLFALEW
jgi:hypothetical protein